MASDGNVSLDNTIIGASSSCSRMLLAGRKDATDSRAPTLLTSGAWPNLARCNSHRPSSKKSGQLRGICSGCWRILCKDKSIGGSSCVDEARTWVGEMAQISPPGVQAREKSGKCKRACLVKYRRWRSYERGVLAITADRVGGDSLSAAACRAPSRWLQGHLLSSNTLADPTTRLTSYLSSVDAPFSVNKRHALYPTAVHRSTSGTSYASRRDRVRVATASTVYAAAAAGRLMVCRHG